MLYGNARDEVKVNDPSEPTEMPILVTLWRPPLAVCLEFDSLQATAPCPPYSSLCAPPSRHFPPSRRIYLVRLSSVHRQVYLPENQYSSVTTSLSQNTKPAAPGCQTYSARTFALSFSDETSHSRSQHVRSGQSGRCGWSLLLRRSIN